MCKKDLFRELRSKKRHLNWYIEYFINDVLLHESATLFEMTTETTTETRPLMPLQEAHLREFIATGAATRIHAAGQKDGFQLHVHIGVAHGVLANARGVIRTFSSLNTLAGLVKRLGASQFDVVIGDFSTSEQIQPMKLSKAKVSLTKYYKKPN